MLTALLVALQQAAAPAASPVASIQLLPAAPVVAAGDTLRLRGEALDAAGRPVAGATLQFFGAGARFEGRVRPDGLVMAGSIGELPVRVVAAVEGSRPSRPFETLVRVVPGPADSIVIEPAASRLVAGQRLLLRTAVYSARGDRTAEPVRWRSSAPGIVGVDDDGLVLAARPGQATLSATAGAAARTIAVTVVPNTVRGLEIAGGAGEARTGDVLRFRAQARDAAGRDVGGLQAEWSLAGGLGVLDADGAFVAYEPGTYTISAAVGAQRATAIVHVRSRDVRRATRVVGRQSFPGFAGGEFWPHPDGTHAYYSTQADRLYALDISNPAALRITDSVVVDARVINDVMTTADGRWGVMTREGASSRRNGIVILDLADPAHPRVAADYTETVSGGVHSAFVATQPRFGTQVYLTDDATGSLRIIDLTTPTQPREIARWQPRENLWGNYVHDVEVRDGLAYLAYWNDGLIILDVGAGVRGGSPSNPQLVTQLKYDLDSLYRDVAVDGGAGFTRGTHTAWRHGRYVFVGDEVFSLRPMGVAWPNRGDLGLANGRLHVVDVSDITNPRLVAWYEPKDGGAHNVWVAGDTLYLGDYQGGLRVLDIGGELRGDLLAQGREIAHLHTGDARGVVPNAAMAWGAFYHNGLVWVNDVFSGLWAVRVEPRAVPGRREAVP